MKPCLLLLLAALALPSAAGAVTVAGGWSLSGDALAGTGLEIRTSRRAADFAFDLDDGEQRRLRLFRIWTDEADVGSDDRVAQALAVRFALADADEGGPGIGGSIGGTVRGRAALEQWGSLTWSAPLALAVKGGTLSILLSDQSFNRGILGLAGGRDGGADVFARVRYVAGVTASPVPVPAGLPLLVAGLGLLALLRRTGARA